MDRVARSAWRNGIATLAVVLGVAPTATAGKLLPPRISSNQPAAVPTITANYMADADLPIRKSIIPVQAQEAVPPTPPPSRRAPVSAAESRAPVVSADSRAPAVSTDPQAPLDPGVIDVPEKVATSAPAAAAPEPNRDLPLTSPHKRSCEYQFSIDLLAMRPTLQDLDFALVDFNGDGNADGAQSNLRLPFSAGVRASLGYLTGCGWDLEATYMNLHSANQRTVTATTGGLLLTRAQAATNPLLATNVDAGAGVDFNVIDFKFAQWLNVSDSLALRYVVGPRVAALQQNLTVNTSGLTSAGVAVAGQDRFESGQHYLGAGLRTGGEVHWIFKKNVTVFASVAGSLLYGDFNHEQSETRSGNNVAIVNDKFRGVSPVLESAIGASWCWGCLQMCAGYEIASWINIHERVDISSTATNGKLATSMSSLGLDGAFIRFMYNF